MWISVMDEWHGVSLQLDEWCGAMSFGSWLLICLVFGVSGAVAVLMLLPFFLPEYFWTTGEPCGPHIIYLAYRLASCQATHPWGQMSWAPPYYIVIFWAAEHNPIVDVYIFSKLLIFISKHDTFSLLNPSAIIRHNLEVLWHGQMLLGSGGGGEGRGGELLNTKGEGMPKRWRQES